MNQRDIIINLYSTCYLSLILMKFELSRQVFKKYSNINDFHENPSSGSRVVPCGRTDRQTDRQTFAFRNFTNVSNNELYPTTVAEHRTHMETVG